MAFSTSQLEEIADWCAQSGELQSTRAEAKQLFFGDEDRGAQYWPGTQDLITRERRFLGWFMFTFRLPDGRTPAEFAVEHVRLAQADDVRRALLGHRWVVAVVSTILRAGTVFLELEDETFEVRGREWARLLQRGYAVAVHLIPVRDVWLVGPGWVELPFAIGPGMREHLRRFQPDPIAIERLLQGGEPGPMEFGSGEEPTLEDAVARMTEIALQMNRPELVMSAEQWTDLVCEHFDDLSTTAFFQEVIRRAGDAASDQQIELLTSLASEIWNTTPQPDRGGLTAIELARLGRLPRDR